MKFSYQVDFSCMPSSNAVLNCCSEVWTFYIMRYVMRNRFGPNPVSFAAAKSPQRWHLLLLIEVVIAHSH
jgi:hypothetical protein